MSIAENIARPINSRNKNAARLTGMRGPEAKRSIHAKVLITAAVSKTAGMTVENEIVASKSNSSGANRSRPRYSQLLVRRLISSKSHHTIAETANNDTKCFLERNQSELPVRAWTAASAVRMYPSQSGKKRKAVRAPGRVQFNGQHIATRISPAQPRAGQRRLPLVTAAKRSWVF